jgi:dTDP-4-dehydrorhamnose reductase
VGRRARSPRLEHLIAGPVGTRRVVVTGAGGQLGAALVDSFAEATVVALAHRDWDVTTPAPDLGAVDLVLHTAAWTDVDGAESDPQEAAAVNVGGTQHAAQIGAPLVAFSTDYVFNGKKGTAYVESDAPDPLSAYGRTKLHGEAAAGEDAWIVRSSWLFGGTGRNFVRTMLELGAAQDEVAVVDDQTGSPTFVGHLAAAVHELVDLPRGLWHVAADGECTWAEFAEAVFEESGVECRVRRISTAELGRPAARPAYSVLRSERDRAPQLPHWRVGLREYLDRLGR